MATTKRTVKPLKAKRHVVKLAEIAFNELSLSGSLNSKADTERLWRMMRGMQWLDEEVGRVRGTVMHLLETWDREPSVDEQLQAGFFGAVVDRTNKLIAGLRELAKIQDPEKAEQYEKEVRSITFEEAVTTIKAMARDLSQLDEDKAGELLETLTGKPIRITTRNPKLPQIRSPLDMLLPR